MAADVHTAETKRPGPFVRIPAFLATAALILGGVFLTANWEKINFDYVKRQFAYRSLARNESGQVESFSYNGGVSSSFAEVNADLLVCSSTGIRLYSPGGTAYVDRPCVLKNPVLTVGGSAALVYDIGGTELYVYRNREEVFSLTGSDARCILSASLSAQGLLTVVTRTSGAKGAVTVYDASFRRLFGVNLSSRFVTDAVLSPDGSTLALATAGQTEGIYDSQIAFYRLDRSTEQQTPDAICSLGNDAILAMDWSASPLRVLGENALSFVGPDGSLTGSYPFGYRYLKGFSLNGDGFCALLLGKYRAGTEAELVTVNPQGGELSSLTLDEQVLSLSSAGKYLSILTADGLTIYTGNLTRYHTLTDLQGARKLLQRADGSVLLIAHENARLYLPQ